MAKKKKVAKKKTKGSKTSKASKKTSKKRKARSKDSLTLNAAAKTKVQEIVAGERSPIDYDQPQGIWQPMPGEVTPKAGESIAAFKKRGGLIPIPPPRIRTSRSGHTAQEKPWQPIDGMTAVMAMGVLKGIYCGANMGLRGFCDNPPTQQAFDRRPEAPPWRCSIHGGMTEGVLDNRAAVKLGIYAYTLSDRELDMIGRVDLDSLDEEILLTKLRLMKAYEAQYEQEAALNSTHSSRRKTAMRIVETHDEVATTKLGTAVKHSKKRALKDYDTIINRTIRQLVALQQAKHTILGGDKSTPEERAADVRAALKSMDDSIGGTDV